jgi:hypothetical protein
MGLPSFDMITYPTYPAHVHPASLQSFSTRLLSSSPYSLPASEAKLLMNRRAEDVENEATTWRSPPPEPDEPDAWRG